jgi:hypothetical protein
MRMAATENLIESNFVFVNISTAVRHLYWLWFGGGFIVGIIGVIIFVSVRNKKKNARQKEM